MGVGCLVGEAGCVVVDMWGEGLVVCHDGGCQGESRAGGLVKSSLQWKEQNKKFWRIRSRGGYEFRAERTEEFGESPHRG